jgi:hypothetical protein
MSLDFNEQPAHLLPGPYYEEASSKNMRKIVYILPSGRKLKVFIDEANERLGGLFNRASLLPFSNR